MNNALLPESGTSQLGLNYDSKGNLFGHYSYSLSNIFQLELVNAGTFQDVSSTSNRNHQIRDTYLGKIILTLDSEVNYYYLVLKKVICFGVLLGHL